MTIDRRFSQPDAEPTPWADVVRALEAAELYWLTTVRADGRPHVTPLVGVHHDGAVHFSTGVGEQKARNLEQNTRVALTTGTNTWAKGLADLDLDNPEVPLETVAQRRTAAYLAYWEHSPLPRSRKPVGPDMPMYRRSAWGDLAQFHVLDTRQNRDDQVSCTRAQRLPNGYCPEAVNPARTILGEEQRTWLIDGLTGSTARWNVLANQVRFAPTDTDADQGRRGFGDDNWDAYVMHRRRVLDAIKEHQPANPIVITGDAHIHAVRNVPPDFENFDAPPVATEFIGTSISSMQGSSAPTPPVFDPDPNNPHRLFQCNQRGYVRVEVTPEAWRTEHRVVDALQEHAPSSTIARFAVESGNPAAIQEYPTPASV